MKEEQKAVAAAFMSSDVFAALKSKVIQMTLTPVTESMADSDIINIRLAIDRGVMLAFEAMEAAVRPKTERQSPPEIGRLNKRKLAR